MEWHKPKVVEVTQNVMIKDSVSFCTNNKKNPAEPGFLYDIV